MAECTSEAVVTEEDKEPEGGSTEGLTKSQQKKQLRYERLVAKRHVTRAADREKRKRRRAEKREKGEELGPTRGQLRLNTMSASACALRVAVDMDFDAQMAERDTRKTIQQLNFCYAANRRAADPIQLYIVNLKGRGKEMFESVEARKAWDVHSSEEGHEQLFGRENVVYLSSESSNVLTELDYSKAYVIGGLVDHNAHKGFCYRRAVERGLQHARLPIDEFVQLASRRVLTINHVFDILLKFTQCADWKESFLSVIPKRKGVSELPNSTSSADSDGAKQQ